MVEDVEDATFGIRGIAFAHELLQGVSLLDKIGEDEDECALAEPCFSIAGEAIKRCVAVWRGVLERLAEVLEAE